MCHSLSYRGSQDTSDKIFFNTESVRISVITAQPPVERALLIVTFCLHILHLTALAFLNGPHNLSGSSDVGALVVVLLKEAATSVNKEPGPLMRYNGSV